MIFHKHLLSAAAAAVLALGGATSALAQQSGLVNVDIRNVANNIARDLKVDVSQIPVTVQAPISVAANVCGVDANVLSTQAGSGNASCSARSTNSALNELVQGQLKTG